MPAPSSVREFLELVQKSGVVDEKKLDTYADKLRAASALPSKPTEMAGLMVRDGLLTNFQAEQFLLGKWRRFTIGKYKVLERLGAGGMGSVYLCEHKLMRRRVAVKVLPTAKAEEQASLDRFYREARAVAALDHPNIVRAYDIDQDEKLHFLVMEYVDGSSLQDIIKKAGPMDVTRACHYIQQAALGLQHALEAAGLVHRDIKPGNILVDRSGQVKVLDMGLARFFNDEEDNITKKYDENVLGTADYLAPEQALNSHDVDIRADIYSLGATFYYCLTGRTPFNEGTVAQKLIWHQTRQPKPIRAFRNDVPDELLAIIDKMMMKEPSQRYQTPQAVADALEPWTRTPIDPPPEAEMPRLSLAAVGPLNSGDPSMMARPGGPASPAPQRTWQVAPSPASSRPSNPPAGPKSAPAAPTQPSRKAVATPPPPAAPRPARPSSNGRAPGVSPAAAPAGPPQTESLESDEGVSWEKLVADTARPVPRADTAPKSGKKSSDRKPRTPQQPEARGQGPWILGGVAVGLLLLSGIGLLAGFAFGLFGKAPTTTVKAFDGSVVTLSFRGDTDADAVSWIDAFKKVSPGGRIVILDPDVTAPLQVGKNPGYAAPVKDVTIEAAPNMNVRWHPADGGSPTSLIKVYNIEGLTIRGLKLDGQRRLQELISVSHACPGLTLENLDLDGHNRCALIIADASGEEGRPITFSGLKIGPPPPAQPPATPAPGIIITATGNPGMPKPQHIVFRDCVVQGPAFEVLSKQNLDNVDVSRGNKQLVEGNPDLQPVTSLPQAK